MNYPCDTYSKDRAGARQLGRKLEVILRAAGNPNAKVIGDGEPGICYVCGKKLDIVYHAWKANVVTLELKYYAITRDPKMDSALNKCRTASIESMIKEGISSQPCRLCSCVDDRTIVDPAFWQKDSENGYQYNRGFRDDDNPLVSPFLYALMFIERSRYESKLHFMQKEEKSGKRKSPMQEMGY
jgi:hypothetical protein